MNVVTTHPDAAGARGLRVALTREAAAYALILLAAVALRVPRLGGPPFNEGEARQAMAALHLLDSAAADPAMVESPLAFAGAVLGFAVFGVNQAAARLLPSLAGVGLGMLPVAFRRDFGRLPMLLASGLLALSPGAVAASRRVDGGGAAVLCLLLAVWAIWRYVERRSLPILVGGGVGLGLALLADFSTLLGLVGLLFGVGALLLGDDDARSSSKTLRQAAAGVPWRVFVVTLALTVFLVSTLLTTEPGGLGAAADLLGRLARGVVTRPAYAPYVGGLLLLYEPLILLFGIIGMVNGLASNRASVRFLSGWAVGALLIGFVYPGGLPSHVLWMVVPLAALAGLAVAELLTAPTRGTAWSVALHAALVMALLSVATLWMVTFVARPLQPGEAALAFPLRLILVGSLWLMVVVVTLLWASFWGTAHAWRGLGLGALGIGLLLSVTGSAGLAYARASDPHEPWNVAPGQPALDALVETARDVSTIATGHPLEATITVEGSPGGLLAWALRDFRRVRFVEVPNPEVATDMVVTLAGPEPLLGERYVGQDFVIVRAWGPVGLSFEQALHWIFFREADTPASEVRVILWVRDDIYRLLPNEVR